MVKKYDLFISYSSKDKEFVHRLAIDLQERSLSIWFDHWEMKPGDRLRNRINEGISRSRYFLVVLSQNSIDAPWVKVELDSAMIKELENNRIVVIPIMLGEVSDDQIPPDLKGKHYLDFRNLDQYSQNVNRIVGIFDLEKRERQKYLKSLREGALSDLNPIEHLTYLACEYGDQTVQQAALKGLSKHAGNHLAVLGIAKRLLDSWGIGAIKQAIRISSQLVQEGGLILLSSTLFYDSRFISEKLEAINKGLLTYGKKNIASELDKLGDLAELYREPQKVNEWRDKIKHIDDADIREGVVFGSMFGGLVGWQAEVLQPCKSDESVQAINYVKVRIPGLINLYMKNLTPKLKPEVYIGQWEKTSNGSISLRFYHEEETSD